jgi:hypothetical protein
MTDADKGNPNHPDLTTPDIEAELAELEASFAETLGQGQDTGRDRIDAALGELLARHTRILISMSRRLDAIERELQTQRTGWLTRWRGGRH